MSYDPNQPNEQNQPPQQPDYQPPTQYTPPPEYNQPYAQPPAYGQPPYSDVPPVPPMTGYEQPQRSSLRWLWIMLVIVGGIDLWRSTDEELQSLVRGTPLTRPALTGLRRNVAVAIGNSANQDAVDVLSFEPPAGVTAGAPSRYDPLVREHARWAAERLRALGSGL